MVFQASTAWCGYVGLTVEDDESITDSEPRPTNPGQRVEGGDGDGDHCRR